MLTPVISKPVLKLVGVHVYSNNWIHAIILSSPFQILMFNLKRKRIIFFLNIFTRFSYKLYKLVTQNTRQPQQESPFHT